MSSAGDRLVMAFGHSINDKQAVFYRNNKKGNILHQIGQVVDSLIEEAVLAERKQCLSSCSEAMLEAAELIRNKDSMGAEILLRRFILDRSVE